jgi:hypothetical protein
MKSVRHFGQRFWPVREAEHSHHAGSGEHPQPVCLIVPERIDLVRLSALQLSDLVFILNVVVRSRDMIESFLENGDLALVGTGFPTASKPLWRGP